MARIATSLTLIALAFAGLEASAAIQPPKDVRTCADVRAYIQPDQSMTMASFKALLRGAGLNVDARAEEVLDGHCTLSATIPNVVLSQAVLDNPDGGVARISTRVVMREGQCHLTEIRLSGC